MTGKTSLASAARKKWPADPLDFPKGYRPSLRELHSRLATVFHDGMSSSELRSTYQAYVKDYGRYPNRGRGLKYTSGPGVSQRRRDRLAHAAAGK